MSAATIQTWCHRQRLQRFVVKLIVSRQPAGSYVIIDHYLGVTDSQKLPRKTLPTCSSLVLKISKKCEDLVTVACEPPISPSRTSPAENEAREQTHREGRLSALHPFLVIPSLPCHSRLTCFKGHVTLRPEDDEDMWHVYNLISEVSPPIDF